MRKRPPVDLKQLHRTTVRLRGGRLRRASLFPFFDREGVVHAVMLVRPGSDEVLVIDHSTGLLRVSWRGHVDFLVRTSDLLDARGPALEKLLKLWHWDPWRVLHRKPWRTHSAAAALTRTNCVGKFDLPLRGCYTDLAVTGVFFEAKGGGEPRLPESPVHDPNPSPEAEVPAEDHREPPHASLEAAPEAAPEATNPDPASAGTPAPGTPAPAARPAGGTMSGGWRLNPVWERNWPPRVRDDR